MSRPAGRVTFDALRSKRKWRAIRGCPGRFVLVEEGDTFAVQDLVGDRTEIRSYRVAGARDEVLVAVIDGGGTISYRREDGTCVHTLNTPEGFARKLAQLGVGPPA